MANDDVSIRGSVASTPLVGRVSRISYAFPPESCRR